MRSLIAKPGTDRGKRPRARPVVLAAVALVCLSSAPASSAPALDLLDPLPGARSSPDQAYVGFADPACDKYVDGANPQAQDTPTAGSTLSSPWRTVRYAAANLSPGETGCVQPGDYAESNIVAGKSGNPTQPIMLRANGPEASVRIVSPDDDYTFRIESSSQQDFGYWILQGFTIEKGTHDRPAVQVLGSGAGSVRGVTIRQMDMRHGRAGAAVLVRGQVTDVVIRDNWILEFSRYLREVDDQNLPASRYNHAEGYGRDDANAVNLEAFVPQPGRPSLARVLVQNNVMWSMGGDGVQCLGVNDFAGQHPSDPADIDLVDNYVHNPIGAGPGVLVEENGYDIKSCQHVSLRGTSPPRRQGPSYPGSRLNGFRPTEKAKDGGTNPTKDSNNAAGEAIVIHYGARDVLVQNLTIDNACTGIAVGTETTRPQRLLIRQILVRGLEWREGPTASDAARCAGQGIRITNAQHVDVVQSSVFHAPVSALRVTPDAASQPKTSDIDVWNNLLTLGPRPVLDGQPVSQYFMDVDATQLDSNYQLFARNAGAQGDVVFRVAGVGLNAATWSATHPNDKFAPIGVSWDDPAQGVWALARDAGLTNSGVGVCGPAVDIGHFEQC